MSTLSSKLPVVFSFASCLLAAAFLYNELQKKKKKKLTIFHFNDVYEISGTGPGTPTAAQFISYLKRLKAMASQKSLCIFSGDAFNPSKLSLVTRLGKEFTNTVEIESF